MLQQLNFHHLHYFWAVAKQGNLTRTAASLRVSQSALSAQIRQLEQQLGVALFERSGRRLVLTEAGKIALAFADDIFTAGTQLLATLEGGRHDDLLRVGTVATLSRNFQESFIQPLLERPGLRLRLVAGMLDELRAARLRGASAAERLLLIEHWRQQRCTGCTLTCLHPVPELPPALRQHYSRRPR